MRVTHTFPVWAKCPNKLINVDNTDTYEGQAVMDRLMKVEDIMEIVDSYGEKRIYQENLCQELADKLKAQVTLRGEHSGVKTEVTCEPIG